MTRLLSVQGSWLEIKGTTSIHDWRARSCDVTGFMEVGPDFPQDRAAVAESLETRVRAEMSLPVRSLKSIDLNGKPFSAKFDDLVHTALQAETQPTISYRLTELVRVRPVVIGASNHFESKGELSLGGVTNRVSIPVQIVVVEGGKLNVIGSATVRMSAFQIKPPLPVLVDIGRLKYDDEVRVSFEWLLQKYQNLPGTKSH